MRGGNADKTQLNCSKNSNKRQSSERGNFMKLNRITAVLLAFFLSFSLIGMNAQPVSAVKAGDLGIHLSKPERSYNSKTGRYSMKVTIRNDGYYILRISAYLYNAEGKRLVKWENGGNFYYAYPGEELSLKFAADYSKYHSSSYSFVYKVKVYDYYTWEEKHNFKKTWTITPQEITAPSMKFKNMTYHTLDSGRVVSRINVECKNMKGKTLNWYYYDEYGYLVKMKEGSKIGSNNCTIWYAWGGVTDGVQYEDGYYTVEVVSSDGHSISKQFYLDFSHYGYG